MWAVSEVAEQVSGIRHGITPRLGPFIWGFRPQSQSQICAIFEEVLVARAEGIGRSLSTSMVRTTSPVAGSRTGRCDSDNVLPKAGR